MKTTRTFLIGAAGLAAALAAATAGLAQPPGPGAAPRLVQRQDAPRDPAQREERIRQELGITSAQEAAFQAWLAATGPGARPPQGEAQALTAPERLNRQLGELQALAGATSQLYNQLTPEQRATFDRLPIGPGAPRAVALRGAAISDRAVVLRERAGEIRERAVQRREGAF